MRKIFWDRRLVLVRDAGREDESVREIPVSDLDENVVDMRTLFLFMSPKVREVAVSDRRKIWLETRGYDSETQNDVPEAIGQFLVLGGTTEGRIAAEALLDAGYGVSVSVARDTGACTTPKGAGQLIGPRDADGWKRIFCDDSIKSRLMGVVDTSHPFAINATQEMHKACVESGIPMCRYIRPEVIPDGAVVRKTPEEAVQTAIELTKPGDTIFLATGVNMLPQLLPLLRASERGVLVRMLPTEQSMKEAAEAGLDPREIIAIWGAGGAAFNEALYAERKIKCVISKASGNIGGVSAKGEAAANAGVPMVLVARPEEPEGIDEVSDMSGLLQWCACKMSVKGPSH